MCHEKKEDEDSLSLKLVDASLHSRITLKRSKKDYLSSPLEGLQGYNPYPHRDAVCMLELVVLFLNGHKTVKKNNNNKVLKTEIGKRNNCIDTSNDKLMRCNGYRRRK